MLIIFLATMHFTELLGIFLGRKRVYDYVFAKNTFRSENCCMLRFYFDERERISVNYCTCEVEGYRMASLSQEPLLHSIIAFPAMIAQSNFLPSRESYGLARL